MDDDAGLDWRRDCREEGRQTDEGGEEETEADGRQQPGGSLVPHRYDVDYFLFLVSVLCLRPTPPSLVSHTRSVAPVLFVPKHGSHVLRVRPTLACLLACLFVCLFAPRACVCTYVSEGPESLPKVC